jgi:hypothetical protein
MANPGVSLVLGNSTIGLRNFDEARWFFCENGRMILLS